MLKSYYDALYHPKVPWSIEYVLVFFLKIGYIEREKCDLITSSLGNMPKVTMLWSITAF